MKQGEGFTLLELLVVVGIIGILSAIAIPQFSEYRARGFDARARSDLRNVAVAEDAYFVEHNRYLACGPTVNGDECNSLPAVKNVSSGTTLEIRVAEDGGSFTGTARHSSGTGVTCRWDSLAGGMLGCNQSD